MTTEIIQFFPDNWQEYWPAIDTSCGYPHVNIHVKYLTTGSMILEEISLPKREAILFNFVEWPNLLLEVMKMVSLYNSVEI